MMWNWQRSDWPGFIWDKNLLRKAEEEFLVGSGVGEGTVKHLDAAERELLTVEAMSSEAITTSEIEGEILDRASVQSSIRKALGLATGERNVRPAEEGIAKVVTDLCRSFGEPLSEETLFSWHEKMLQGRKDLKDIGRYRRSKEPMQIVSGAPHTHVHFEAPPSFQRCERDEVLHPVVQPHRAGRQRAVARVDARRDRSSLL